MTSTLDLETIVVRGPRHRWTRLGNDETLILDADLRHYFGLNSVASRVWDMVETPVTVGEICASLLAEFEVDALTCEAEVSALIGELLDNGLVHRVDENGGGAR